MENYSYSSYPDSVNSSPRSRQGDIETASWDEPPTTNYKVKFLCSYGGKIQPRPHDNQLTYVGGDTKILTVDRTIKFANLATKLYNMCDSEVSFKYQLPGEDLDALISVTNDEDLDHMLLEYDRLCKSSAKPARLRLFLFNLKRGGNGSSFGSSESKSERQWFVDALNSANLEAVDEQPPPLPPVVAADTPDYLFGLEDKSRPNHTALPPEEVVGQPSAEINRQIEDLQRLQISGQDQSPRYYRGEYNENYQQNVSPPPPQQTAFPVNSQAGAYWPEQHRPGGQYSHPQVQTEQPVYLIQTPTGIYQAPQPVRQMTGQPGQGYYGVQRMVPEVYREQQVYNQVPHQNQQHNYTGAYNTETVGNQQHNYSGGYNAETAGFMRGPPESAYTQVAIDGAGRQVYYTTQGGMVTGPPAQGGMVATPPLQGVSTAGAALFFPGNQGVSAAGGPGYVPEVKVASKVTQPPPL